MLPYLKDRHEGGMSGEFETKKRMTDDEDEISFEMLDAIVDDLMEAFHKKDKKLLKASLEALIEHIQEADELQDSEDMHD